MLDRDAFAHVVRHAPLVSIDLLVRDERGRLLVGLRKNRPAQGTWFVPGGIVRKGERIGQAMKRITKAELGSELAGRFAGVFEHFYPDNALGEAGFGTHYVVLAYAFAGRIDALPEDQHTRYRWIGEAEGLADPAVHENTKAYLACAK